MIRDLEKMQAAKMAQLTKGASKLNKKREAAEEAAAEKASAKAAKKQK